MSQQTIYSESLTKDKNMITHEQIHLRIRNALRTSGLSQVQIARKLNVTQQTVSCYSMGSKLPSLDTFANLCEVLDEDPAYLLCLDGEEKSPLKRERERQETNGIQEARGSNPLISTTKKDRL